MEKGTNESNGINATTGCSTYLLTIHISKWMGALSLEFPLGFYPIPIEIYVFHLRISQYICANHLYNNRVGKEGLQKKNCYYIYQKREDNGL